jgi:hypothetical protein
VIVDEKEKFQHQAKVAKNKYLIAYEEYKKSKQYQVTVYNTCSQSTMA